MENTNKHSSSKYSSPLPFPEIKVMGINKYYASILMEDYTGMASEMTAIMQYLYHSFVFSESNEELGKIIEGIAITEMHHLDILAELIVKLGGNPIYYNKNSYWNGSFVHYGEDVYDRIRTNLESEYKAINNYQKHICIIQDPYVQSILKRIILDEEVHIQIFKEIINKRCLK